MGKWYPTEDAPTKRSKSRTWRQNKTKLRGGITPGQVLVVLAGKHKGKRVVYLTQLSTGEIVVTGPHKFNRCPLKKLAQSFTMPTSTVVDLSGLNFDINEQHFVKEKPQQTSEEAQFFAKDKQPKELPDWKKSKQLEVDNQVVERVQRVPQLRKYLSTRFTLRNGMYPHQLKF